MQFIEHPKLSRLSAFLKELDVGDRILCGRLELLSTSDALTGLRKIVNNSQQEDSDAQKSNDKTDEQPEPWLEMNQSSSPQLSEISDQDDDLTLDKKACQDNSAEFPVSPREQQIYNLFITTLNLCFPHYDFNDVGPEAFPRVQDFLSVYAAINYHLSFLAEVVIPGFLQDLWSAIKDAIDLRSSLIYSFNKLTGHYGSDPYLDEEGCLSSFDYFFVDVKHQRIFYFSCMTKQKHSLYSEESIFEMVTPVSTISVEDSSAQLCDIQLIKTSSSTDISQVDDDKPTWNSVILAETYEHEVEDVPYIYCESPYSSSSENYVVDSPDVASHALYVEPHSFRCI